MSWKYDRWWSPVTGWLNLPIFEGASDISLPPSEPSITPLLGHTVYYGGPLRDVPKIPSTVERRGLWIEDSETDLYARYQQLSAAMWTKGKLFRRSGTGLSQWKWAILQEAPGMSREHATIFRVGTKYSLPVTLRFQILSPLWNGFYHGRGFGTGEEYDTGLVGDYNVAADTFALTGTSLNVAGYVNGGDRAQRWMQFLVTVGSATLTQLVFQNITTGHRLTSNVSVGAGAQFLIDTERRAVEYITFVGAGGIAPGATTIPVTASALAAINGSISVLLNNGEVWATRVLTKPSGTSVTVPEPGAPSTANAGNRIGFGAYMSSTGVPQLTWNQSDWFQFASGPNSLALTRTGGGTATSILAMWHEASA